MHGKHTNLLHGKACIAGAPKSTSFVQLPSKHKLVHRKMRGRHAIKVLKQNSASASSTNAQRQRYKGLEPRVEHLLEGGLRGVHSGLVACGSRPPGSLHHLVLLHSIPQIHQLMLHLCCAAVGTCTSLLLHYDFLSIITSLTLSHCCSLHTHMGGLHGVDPWLYVYHCCPAVLQEPFVQKHGAMQTLCR